MSSQVTIVLKICIILSDLLSVYFPLSLPAFKQSVVLVLLGASLAFVSKSADL